MESDLSLRNFTLDLRVLCNKRVNSISPRLEIAPSGDVTTAHRINLKTEILALTAFDPQLTQNDNSGLNAALRNFFVSCRKLPHYDETKTPLILFGGLGTQAFNSMEVASPVKSFRNLPEVQQRLSEIFSLLGFTIEPLDQLGNIIHDTRQVVYVLGMNPQVDKDSLLALIRRCWSQVGGKTSTTEQTPLFPGLPHRAYCDFGEPESAILADLFSTKAVQNQPPYDAIELAMRRNVADSIRQSRGGKSMAASTQPDDWTRLKALLEPVCRSLSMEMKQVVEMVFHLLKSNLSDESLQSELIDMIGFEQFDVVSVLIRERADWIRWYAKYSVNLEATNASRRDGKASRRKNRFNGSAPTTTGNCDLIEQLLNDPASLAAQREMELLNSAAEARNAAAEAYKRASAILEIKEPPLPYVFDAMAEMLATRGAVEKSKLCLPADTKHKRTELYESYDFPLPPLKPSKATDDPVLDIVRHVLPGGKLVEVSSLDRVAQLALKGVKRLNVIQSVVFETAYKTNENMLICAPTGAGKTNTALLTILALIKQHFNPESGVLATENFKIVYMAPMKALAAEMAKTFGERLAPLGVRVRECTGDTQLTAQEIHDTQMLITTPEKWDVLSRKSGAGGGGDEANLIDSLGLLIVDEVHSLATAKRGAVVETLVARTLRRVESAQRAVRLVGLSATLPNHKDVAALLRVNLRKGLFVFDSRFRPVPLAMSFVGVRTGGGGGSGDAGMNRACYERVVQQLRHQQQVMVFVHARGETVRTARWLIDTASQNGETELFLPPEANRNIDILKQLQKCGDAVLRELGPRGVGCHHAGMLRPDRLLVERAFRSGDLRVLVCTATLAWGVNLPAHAVVIKGTRLYNADAADFVDLDILDVLQIFGRAGRPQFDTSGQATIITTHDKLDKYVKMITNQVPIESQLLDCLNDHLNAEIALGTVSTVSEAVTWLSYTFLFVRLTKSPMHYGITPAMLAEDPDLTQFLMKAIENAARELDDAEMIRYEPSTGQLASTDRGRTASLYYITYETAAMVRERMKHVMILQDLIGLIADASEFAQMKVRDEEEAELLELQDGGCVVPIRNPGTVEGNLAVKVNVLLQAHISRMRPTACHSLVADMYYVQQNAGRLARYLFEIAMRRAWAVCATSAHRLSKMIEHRLWYNQTPLWQFTDANTDHCRILERVDELDLRVDKIREMSTADLNGILQYQGIRGAEFVSRLASYLPILELQVETQPVTRTILRITVKLTANFTWNDRIHGSGGSLLYWIWVEDPDEASIYHSEAFSLNKKTYVKAKSEPLAELVFTIPIHDPLPSQYVVQCISDRFLGAETAAPVYLRNILLPQADPPHTDLLPLQPLSISALRNPKYEALYNFTHFNPIQTQVFHTMYHQDVNVLLGAPTGSGKTAVAEMAIFRVFNNTPEKKCVYIAPLKALVRERVDDWKIRIERKLGKRVVELTGDVSPDAALLRHADVIVTTPEKWDGVSRSWKQRNYVRQIALIVIDEIHMVGEDRGPVLEAIVSRANFIANQLSTRVRVVGLSTALANAVDMAVWLRVPITPVGVDKGTSGRGLFNFRPSVRPVPLEVHIQAYPGRHYCPRMALMNKPIFQAIQSHSANKPVLIFVASRRQTRRTAFDLISHASADFCPRQWLHMDIEEMEALASTMTDQNLQLTLHYGIGIHHAGLRDRDRRIVEELFVNQKIQVLIATSTLAWGVNFPAHLVIVKGTEYFDGKTKRYVDYPITDVLQMMGRAGRPQFDNEGKAVVMVQDTKKAFYKRFLYEPFPVESCLPRILPDYLNAEIAAGSVETMQGAVECLTWTFFFRRLLMNPNYYGLEDTSAAAVSAFLSSVVAEAIQHLLDSGCVEVGEPEVAEAADESQEPKTVIPVYSTDLGRLAAFYYVSHKTIRLFAEGVSAKTSIEDLIYLLSMSEEFADIPVRHSEDEVNAALAREFPLRIREPPESGHAKAHLLLQAHLSRRTAQLPVADYVTDTASLLDQVPRLLSALLDTSVAASDCLSVALRCVLLTQMIARGIWLCESPLLQLSSALNSSHLHAFHLSDREEYIESLPHLLEVAGPPPKFPSLNALLSDELAPNIIEEIKRTLLCLPIVSVELSLVGGRSSQKIPIIDLDISREDAREYPLEVALNTDYALCVTLHYENTPKLLPKGINGRQSRPPGWVVVLGDPRAQEGGTVLALKKTTFKRSPLRTNVVSLNFRIEEQEVKTFSEGEARELCVYLMSDCFVSMDQQFAFCVRLKRGVGEEELEDSDDYDDEGEL